MVKKTVQKTFPPVSRCFHILYPETELIAHIIAGLRGTSGYIAMITGTKNINELIDLTPVCEHWLDEL